MNIVICEDNKYDMSHLYNCVDRFFKENNCAVKIETYDSGDSLLGGCRLQQNKDIKIAFMDIYMPGTLGVDVAKKIRETDNETAIVFTTSSRDHALDGYEVDALQYLLKPIEYVQVKNVLTKCMSMFAEQMRYIELTSNRLTTRVLLKDILFVEIFNHTCIIHTVHEKIKNYHPLDEIEQMISAKTGGSSSFLRTHRSYLLNMRYIDDMNDNDFVLTNGASVPIRRKDKTAIKQVYMDYLFTQARNIEY